VRINPGEIRGTVNRIDGEITVVWNGVTQTAQEWQDSPMVGNLSMRSVSIILQLIIVAKDAMGDCEFRFIQPSEWSDSVKG
jgi:hypothetical protein